MSISPVNINTVGHTINFTAGSYHVYILDGFGVTLNNFGIQLIDSTGKAIDTKDATWPVQNKDKRKSKRILSIEIPKSGEYIVKFSNPKSVVLWPSKLFLKRIFSLQIPNEEIEIYFAPKQ